MIDFNLNLQNDKILLRPLIAADYISFERITTDPVVWTYFTYDLSVKSDLKIWVDTAVRDIKNKSRLAFTIIDKMSGKVREEGILRSHMLMTHNHRRDTVYYSILRNEWEDVKIRNKWDAKSEDFA